jgi:hypothetical protein
MAANFYAIELASGGRYLRRVANVSREGLLLESKLCDERLGQVVELELPMREQQQPMRVKAQVVRMTAAGPMSQIGVRCIDAAGPLPVEALGGQEAL